MLKKLGATVVDPGPKGRCFSSASRACAPELLSSAFAAQYRTLFPVNASGQPEGDHIATFVEMRANPSRVPDALTLRTPRRGFGATGEDKYMMNRYLRERGDANIKTNADLIAKATFYDDPNFPNRRAAREQAERATDARYVGPRAHALRGADDAAELHGGADARRARGADVHRAAAEAPVTARAAKQRSHADRLVHVRAAGIPGHRRAGWFHDGRVGPGTRRQRDTAGRTSRGEAARWGGLHRQAVRRATAVPHRRRIRGRDEEPAAA